MARRISITALRAKIAELQKDVQRYNFYIDLSFKLYQYFLKYLDHKPDVNKKVLAAYWGLEVMAIWEAKKWPLYAREVFIELEYYSFLNLIELENNAAAGGYNVQISDFIFDTTPLKEGDDLGEWMLTNDDFRENMRAHWVDEIMDIWQSKGWLHHKKGANLENYWSYEDYIFMIRVMDYELNPIWIGLLGTYSDY